MTTHASLFHVGHVDERIIESHALIGKQVIHQVIAGCSQQLVLTATNRLLLSGTGDCMGRYGDVTLLDITDDVMESNDQVHLVTSKGWHVIIVSKQGRVYSFGNNDVGQCGFSPELLHCLGKPHFLKELYAQDPHIQFASTGTGHSCVASDFHVYAFGRNNNGRLGHPPSLHCNCDFAPVPFFESLFDNGRNGIRVNALSCSCKKTFVLDSRGEVYVMGADPQPQKLVLDVPIKAMASGDFFTFFLSHDGYLYGEGDNHHGQLGLGEKGNPIVRQPTKLPSLIKVRKIVCGSNHALAITCRNKVLVWGKQADERLGEKKGKDVLRPVPFRSSWDIQVKDAAGAPHGFVLSNQPWIEPTRLNKDHSYQQTKLWAICLRHQRHTWHDIIVTTLQ